LLNPVLYIKDPVHFWPDQDPANQNSKNRIQIRIWIQILDPGSYWHLPRISSNI